MNIVFKTNKLENECKSITIATKAYGANNARKLIRRLYDIQAANTLADLSPLPPTRCHRLKEYKKRFLAIDLEQPNRLILLPIDDDGNALDLDKVSLSQISNVKIMEVSKHYD